MCASKHRGASKFVHVQAHAHRPRMNRDDKSTASQQNTAVDAPSEWIGRRPSGVVLLPPVESRDERQFGRRDGRHLGRRRDDRRPPHVRPCPAIVSLNCSHFNTRRVGCRQPSTAAVACPQCRLTAIHTMALPLIMATRTRCSAAQEASWAASCPSSRAETGTTGPLPWGLGGEFRLVILHPAWKEAVYVGITS